MIVGRSLNDSPRAPVRSFTFKYVVLYFLYQPSFRFGC